MESLADGSVEKVSERDGIEEYGSLAVGIV
jgi:hypothetical protein